MKTMNGFILDGDKLEIELSDPKNNSCRGRVAPKDHGTKLIVHNIPFEAIRTFKDSIDPSASGWLRLLTRSLSWL